MNIRARLHFGYIFISLWLFSGFGSSVANAAEIENFDQPKRNLLIKEILGLLEIPNGGGITLSQSPCPSCPSSPDQSLFRDQKATTASLKNDINTSLDNISSSRISSDINGGNSRIASNTGNYQAVPAAGLSVSNERPSSTGNAGFMNNNEGAATGSKIPVVDALQKGQAFEAAKISNISTSATHNKTRSINSGASPIAKITSGAIVTKTNMLPAADAASDIKIAKGVITAQAPTILVRAQPGDVKYVTDGTAEDQTSDEETASPQGGTNEVPKTLAEALAKERSRAGKRNKIKVTGELYSSIGLYTNGEVRVNRANPDLNERNWRILSDKALNNRLDTYDPALYSRMKFVVDASIGTAVATHINVTIDPWSYTGKSKEITLDQGDQVKFQYLTVGSNNYTVPRILRTIKYGDAMALPETKVFNGNEIPAMRVNTLNGGSFDLPDRKLSYTFMPVREAWVDFKPTDSLFFRAFPLAYQDQALTSDDPLQLSNHRNYWEESPWLRSWQPGTVNQAFPDFAWYTKGIWDRSLSFATRDSTGQRLTGLRGAKFGFYPEPDTTLDFVVASPKTLWQDYTRFDTLAASARLKHYFDDGFYIGGTAADHQGFLKSTTDARNYVGGVDTGIMPFENVKFNAEYSFSSSQYDITDAKFQTKQHGNAYYASLIATSDPYMMNKKDYYGIASGSKDSDFYKTKVFVGRMDQNFESTLSNYHSTRKDSFWNRHLTFYPSIYRYLPGIAQMAYTGEDDLSVNAIGDGMDYGRMSYGWRGDVGMLDGALKGLMDIRQVSNVTAGKHHKKIETVAQTHWDLKVNEDLTTKFILIRNQMPKTTAGVDPHVTDGDTGEPLKNAAVLGGKDPSTTTASIGARYQLTDWAALNGVWEYTNDSTLATDNFPQADLNSSFFTFYRQDTRPYTTLVPFVYSGGLFDQPPYNYFNIFKTGVEFIPTDKWHIYLDFTRNSNVFAGSIDDNMNHFGVETSYLLTKNWGLFARYSYARWNDFTQLAKPVPEIDYRGYHNVYFASRWVFAPDSWLALEYGVGPAYNVATNVYDPRLAYYATTVLNTQHIFRLSVLKKF